MRFTRRKFLQTAGMAVGASALGLPNTGNAQSDQYPSKPINMIIASAAGGSSDLTSRTLAPLSQEIFGQPMILQIRPGGGGAVGTELVYQAKPDGYTLSFAHSNWNSVLPALEGRSRGPGEMEPVCRINLQNVIYWVAANSPWNSMQDVIAYAKANPGKLAFGNSGLWSVTDIMWRWFNLKAGINTRNVTMAGGGETIIQLLGGHIQISSIGPPQSLPHYRAGKIKPLAIEARKRYKGLPNVPTMAELGYNNGLEGLWKAVLAPKGTPKAIIDKLAAGFKKMVEDKRAIDALAQLGEDFEYQGTAEFAKYWQDDYAVYKEMAKLFKKES